VEAIVRLGGGQVGEGARRWFDNSIRRVVGDGNDTLF